MTVLAAARAGGRCRSLALDPRAGLCPGPAAMELDAHRATPDQRSPGTDRVANIFLRLNPRKVIFRMLFLGTPTHVRLHFRACKLFAVLC